MSIRSIDAPIAVRTIDVGVEPVDVALGRDPDGREYNGLYAIATRDGLATGAFCVPAVGGTVTADVLRGAIAALAPAGGEGASKQSTASGPLVSVVICAIDGGTAAVRTVETLLTGTYQPIEVIVVNNRPGDGGLDPATAAFAGDSRVRTADEHRPGLSYARNAGIAAASGEIIAFTDDDAVPDARWIERIVAAFSETPGAACVTGLIVPLALDTDAQVLLERFAGYSKGFARRRWSMTENANEPLFPYRAGQFGSGANIALRSDAIARLGGYDDALGIGTPANGGEDLDIFIRVLMHGMELVYEPSAMVWHEHPRTIEHIEREVALYGSGLTAALFKQLLHGPRRGRLLRSVGGGLRYALSPSSEKNERKGEGFPLSYTLAELRGMLYGPIGYLRSRRFAKRNSVVRKARRNALMGLLVTVGMLGGGESTEPARAEGGESARSARVSNRGQMTGGPPQEPLPVEISPGAASFEPTWVGELELNDAPADLVAGLRDDRREFTRASVLVRLDGEPVGFVKLPLTGGRIGADEVRAAIADRFGERIERMRAEAAARPSNTPSTPFVSVVICSRDRAESLGRTLDSVLALDYPNFEVVVVDNAPGTPGTRRAVETTNSASVRYTAEPLPGLSRARNRGLREARGEIFAFTDDDVVVDPQWLGRLVAGFESAERVGCVTGLVPTAELRTPEQQIFDDSVNWSETIERRVFDMGEHRSQDAMFPYRTGRFGTGANFALIRAAAVDVGSFDEALGAGSPAGGGEDLDYFLRLVDRGWAVVLEPAAIVWHFHRADAASLERQFYSYGSGAIAYGVKHAVQPRHALRLARQSAVGAARYGRRSVGLGRNSLRFRSSDTLDPGRSLRQAKWRGRIAGPRLYLQGRLRSRDWEPLGALAEPLPEQPSVHTGADDGRNMSDSKHAPTEN